MSEKSSTELITDSERTARLGEGRVLSPEENALLVAAIARMREARRRRAFRLPSHLRAYPKNGLMDQLRDKQRERVEREDF